MGKDVAADPLSVAQHLDLYHAVEGGGAELAQPVVSPRLRHSYDVDRRLAHHREQHVSRASLRELHVICERQLSEAAELTPRPLAGARSYRSRPRRFIKWLVILVHAPTDDYRRAVLTLLGHANITLHSKSSNSQSGTEYRTLSNSLQLPVPSLGLPVPVLPVAVDSF